jgi:HK97 family phage prohead protease
MADEETIQDETLDTPEMPPRDYAVRAVFPGPEMRDGEQEARPIMFGHLAVFDEWAKIDSRVEGQFMERVAPGSFAQTIKQNRSRIRVIYDHGQDPRFGRHPLGPIQELREDQRGPYYEVPLLDNSTNRDLLPGLRAGVYGTSFKFRAVKVDRPVYPTKETEWNPDRWEERTIRELEMVEFGPTPFPVYAGPTAGVRSLTDEYRITQLGIDPEQLRALLTSIALPTDGAAEAHSDEGSRATVPVLTKPPQRIRSDEDWQALLQEIMQ